MKNYNIKNNYHYDMFENTLTVSAEFVKRAGVIGSPEFKIIQEVRKAYPDVQISKRTVAKKAKDEAKKHFTYEEMDAFFKDYYKVENGKENKAYNAFKEEFEKVKTLSHLKKNPYKAVSSWFTEKTADMREELNNYITKREQAKSNIINISAKQEEETYKKAANE